VGIEVATADTARLTADRTVGRNARPTVRRTAAGKEAGSGNPSPRIN